MGSVCPEYQGSSSYGLHGDLSLLAGIYLINLRRQMELRGDTEMIKSHLAQE